MYTNRNLNTAEVIKILDLRKIVGSRSSPSYIHPTQMAPVIIYGHRHPSHVFFELRSTGEKDGRPVELPGRQEFHSKSGAKYSILCAGTGEVFFLDPKEYWNWGLAQARKFTAKRAGDVWRHPELDFMSGSDTIMIPIVALRKSPAVRRYYPSLQALSMAVSEQAQF